MKAMIDLGEGMDSVMMWASVMVNTIQADLVAVMDKSARAACRDLINLSDADSTVTTPPAPASVNDNSTLTFKVAVPFEPLLMDLDNAPSPRAAAAVDSVVANLFGIVSPSARSTMLSPKVPDLAVTIDRWYLMSTGRQGCIC